jgi:hypothetical protein
MNGDRRALAAIRFGVPIGIIVDNSIESLHRGLERPSCEDGPDGVQEPGDSVRRRFPVIDAFDRHANGGGLAIVFPFRKPRAECRAPQTSNELGISRDVGGTGHDDIAVRADNRQSDLRASRKLLHLARALVREEIDVRIVLNEQRKHRTADVSAALVDVEEHGDGGSLDQRAHPLSFDRGVRHAAASRE